VTETERCKRGRLWCFERRERKEGREGRKEQRGERRGLYPAKAATGPCPTRDHPFPDAGLPFENLLFIYIYVLLLSIFYIL
jgi:hypothetical protein